QLNPLLSQSARSLRQLKILQLANYQLAPNLIGGMRSARWAKLMIKWLINSRTSSENWNSGLPIAQKSLRIKLSACGPQPKLREMPRLLTRWKSCWDGLGR